jgi:hypothetical protein
MLSLDKELIKGKRGRKSKKELMASLGLEDINTSVATATTVATVATAPLETVISALEDHISLTVVEMNETPNNNIEELELEIEDENENEIEVVPVAKLALKKRGRKPKGGKIIQQSQLLETQKNDKPNVILHLKCSMKDLQNMSNTVDVIESFAFNKANNLCYDVIGGENINSSNLNNNQSNSSKLNSNKIDDNEYDYNYNDNVNVNVNDSTDANDVKDTTTKELWKKLKQLEHNLHINNVNNKKSACFWDTCDFDNPPVYIPKHFINGTYHVYGCFCSPECGVAYLMNENIDSSTKFERYHLFNHIYSKMYDYKKSIKPAPNPYYMLEKYYGNLSIQDYRALLRNERLFLIVDKPLTRILPELHDDNDDFILNNKIIPSNNNYQLKSRMQRKKPTKNSIMNENFGGSNAT